MSENGVSKWQELKNVLKFWLAGIAIKWCGIETIYWSAPLEWEKYMSEGEPMTPEVYFQSE